MLLFHVYRQTGLFQVLFHLLYCQREDRKIYSRKPGSLTKHVNEWCQVHMRLAKLISCEAPNGFKHSTASLNSRCSHDQPA